MMRSTAQQHTENYSTRVPYSPARRRLRCSSIPSELVRHELFQGRVVCALRLHFDPAVRIVDFSGSMELLLLADLMELLVDSSGLMELLLADLVELLLAEVMDFEIPVRNFRSGDMA